MQISGMVALAAPIHTVWKALITPETLAGCTPGLQSWSEQAPAHTFELQLAWQLTAKNSMNVPVEIVWEALTPPTQMAIAFEIGMGQPPLTGTGDITLSAETTTTTALAFTLELDVTNPMTRKVVQNLAPRFLDTFFSNFRQAVEATPSQSALN